MAQSDHHLEIEVKFHLPDPSQTLKLLEQMGAKARPKVFETNMRYEDDAHTLIQNNCLLRLRRDDQCRLTYKSPPEKQETQCKVYRELEVNVSDFETMAAILNALGFQGVQIYEKERQTFSCQDVLICLDTMPYGNFLEIEGKEQGIRQTAHALCLQWDKRILANYLGIFETLRQEYGLPFKDVTFDNFKMHPVDIEPCLSLFEAGEGSE